MIHQDIDIAFGAFIVLVCLPACCLPICLYLSYLYLSSFMPVSFFCLSFCVCLVVGFRRFVGVWVSAWVRGWVRVVVWCNRERC